MRPVWRVWWLWLVVDMRGRRRVCATRKGRGVGGGVGAGRGGGRRVCIAAVEANVVDAVGEERSSDLRLTPVLLLRGSARIRRPSIRASLIASTEQPAALAAALGSGLELVTDARALVPLPVEPGHVLQIYCAHVGSLLRHRRLQRLEPLLRLGLWPGGQVRLRLCLRGVASLRTLPARLRRSSHRVLLGPGGDSRV